MRRRRRSGLAGRAQAAGSGAQKIASDGQREQDQRRHSGGNGVVRGDMGTEGAQHVEGDAGIGPFAEQAGARIEECAYGEQFGGAQDGAEIGGIAKGVEDVQRGWFVEHIEDATEKKLGSQEGSKDPVEDSADHGGAFLAAKSVPRI